MGRELPERRDARRIYFRLLEQSRSAEFFGPGRFSDNYDGRIDLITLHFAIMMERLNREGEDGALLRQALFDEMKDDFEIALREEGISDTGVKKRIKPMISHFYDRLGIYAEAFSSSPSKGELQTAFLSATGSETVGAFETQLAEYTLALRESLAETPLKSVIARRFYFPDLKTS
jgi:cytochrome b pre-mRNA-processing protein 3